MTHYKSKLVALVGVALALSVLVVEPAEARRGGSFGSRGTRTYTAPRATPTAPGDVAPVQRSMTQRPQDTQAPRPAPTYGQQYPGARPGFFGGLGGGILGGLLAGGLIGSLMGHGWGGGGAGMLSTLLQVAIIGGLVWLALRLFRRPAMAGPGLQAEPAPFPGGGPTFRSPFEGPVSQPSVPVSGGAPSAGPALEIPISQSDRDDFERLLSEVQDAFGHEDYGRLRERTTPEIMSFLAEELSQNATHGRRNEVTGTRLIRGDVAEAWREGDAEYATAAFRYESIDIMRDRVSGAVVAGDPGQPTETTELWTFVRQSGAPWKLSAIQET